MIAGGCHFNRKIDKFITEAGFRLDQMENFYMEGPRIGSYMYRGIAVAED